MMVGKGRAGRRFVFYPGKIMLKSTDAQKSSTHCGARVTVLSATGRNGWEFLSPRLRAYTMVQGMTLLCVLAILSASVPLIYRAVRVHAYETEVVRALSLVKIAQDEYFDRHGTYAGSNTLVAVRDLPGLLQNDSVRIDPRYVSMKDLLISANYPQCDEYLAICLPATKGPGARLPVQGFAMDHRGTLYRGDRNRTGDWRPEFPHLSPP